MKIIARVLLCTAPILAIVLIIVQVIITNNLASVGKRIGMLDMQISQQHDIYGELATQVASASALYALRERAFTLGFQEPTQSQIVSLVPEVPVALRIEQ